MPASKDLLMLVDDAQRTLDRMAKSLSAARAVVALENAPVIGNKAGRIVAQQLINETMRETMSLIEELDAITHKHGKENA